MPRPRNRRRVRNLPTINRFGPYDHRPPGEVELTVEGLEALRLTDVEGLDQQAASDLMGVSRQTFGRILGQARTAAATAICGGLALIIGGGDYEVAPESPTSGGRGGGRGFGGQGRGRNPGRGGGQGGRFR